MWALVLLVSCTYGCKPVTFPERYATELACSSVGKAALAQYTTAKIPRAEENSFFCVNLKG